MTHVEREYEWNAMRKLWHFAGCLLMIAIFYLWKDLNGVIPGADIMVIFAWAETAIALGIDLIRFYSPRSNEAVARLPFYGKLMRRVEKNHFNATTYYLLAAAILATLYRFGLCRESTLVASIMVLGVADPAAAWTRHRLARRGIEYARVYGAFSFVIASFFTLWIVSWALHGPFAPEHLLVIGLVVAIVESYTKYWVLLLHPVTRRVQRLIAHKTTVWLFRFYPDDNLLIPLTVALLMGLLPWFLR